MTSRSWSRWYGTAARARHRTVRGGQTLIVRCTLTASEIYAHVDAAGDAAAVRASCTLAWSSWPVSPILFDAASCVAAGDWSSGKPCMYSSALGNTCLPRVMACTSECIRWSPCSLHRRAHASCPPSAASSSRRLRNRTDAHDGKTGAAREVLQGCELVSARVSWCQLV